MFREFFCEGGFVRCLGAWGGLLLFLAHQCFRAWLKYALNEWYGEWYNLLQTSVADIAPGGSDVGSGASGEDDTPTRAMLRQRVIQKLVEFAGIVAPAVVVHPIAGFLKNHWVFQWRCVLMRSYVDRWVQVEGSAQRVHEDTMRMASGIHTTVATFVESVLTIAVFTPVLQALDPTLMKVAIGCAVGGLSVSIVVGWRLIGLEVANQRVEAALRKRLVLLETDPVACMTTCVAAGEWSVVIVGFLGIFHDLRINYGALYRNFAAFATWLSLYEQTLAALPYVLVGPRLFADDPSAVLTLGEVVKATNAFGRIFDALNVLSDRWVEVNEFFSVVRRLREFERAACSGSPPIACLVAQGCPSSESEMHGFSGSTGAEPCTTRDADDAHATSTTRRTDCV